MDRKEKSLITYYYDKLVDNRLDEKDVYPFLILLSNKGKEIGCIHELADFAVHRGQNEGVIKEYLQKTTDKFENLGKMKAGIRIEDVFSFKEIKNGINKILVDCQLIGLSNEKVNNFITCLISILQHVKITEDGKEIGQLFFAIASKQVMLMAEVDVVQNGQKKTTAVFPVLTANNNYIEIKKKDKYDSPYFFEEKVIEITNQDGKLEIIVPNR